MKPLLLILFGIVTAHAQDLKCQSDDTKATVYFYRVKESNAMRKGETGVTIDKVRLFQMPKATYTGFHVAPGKYELTMGHRETDFLLDAEAGKRYFFRVSNTAAGFSQLQVLTLVSKDQATHQMGGLMPLGVKNIKSRQAECCTCVQTSAFRVFQRE